ncbi:MAG: tRNA (guanosine(37)-N1)-methyltransferase TrmD [Myxococcota bacterium]|nr:tRNA (guanosine(37)-N1)-methyltransferase TrmD [Myxococcota bacterium]
MRISIITLFPHRVEAYVSEGVIGRGIKRGVASVVTINPRDFTEDVHRTVDDVPFGGGAGMVLKAEPMAQAIEALGSSVHRVLLAPSGRPFVQADAVRWSERTHLALVCGRYEGIDERLMNDHIDEVVSIGDYVLSGGELGALVILDATLRLVPGMLGNQTSTVCESFSDGLLEHPHFTRPAEWRGNRVPDVLLSGHHARIDAWRRQRSLIRTARVRPDLIDAAALTAQDEEFLLAHRASTDVEDD